MDRRRAVAHWTIVLVLGTGFLSALYMVFVVYRVPGAGIGPMYGLATEVTPEFFLQRRLYALEAWVTFGFLAVYLGLTSLRPDPGRAEGER
jgi:hypothetical protein